MRLWPVAVLVTVLAVPMRGQPAVSETLEVRLIEIDAVVTDRDGNLVTALSADEPVKVVAAVFDEKSGLSGTRAIPLASWSEALERAQREKKPILAFEKPASCTGQCAAFERQSLKHPAIQRRLEEVVLVRRRSKDTALALYNRRGNLVTRIAGLPRDVTVFASTLDGTISTAWIGIGSIHRGAGAFDEAMRAYSRAAEVSEPGGATYATASASLSQLQGLAGPAGPIRIMPLHEQIVSGRRVVRTIVSSTDVARVLFSIDGEQKVTVDRPPFSTDDRLRPDSPGEDPPRGCPGRDRQGDRAS